jgi:hypothetical protein
VVACVLWAKQRKPILEPRWHNSNQPVLELVSAKPGSAGAMFQQDYYNGSSVTIRWSHLILKKLYFMGRQAGQNQQSSSQAPPSSSEQTPL